LHGLRSTFITETLIPEKVDDEPDSELNDTGGFADTVRGWVDKIVARGNKSEIEAVRALCLGAALFSHPRALLPAAQVSMKPRSADLLTRLPYAHAYKQSSS
jgi:hypothetical protein